MPADRTDLEIVYRDPESLRGYPNNFNKHSPGQLRQLGRSVEQFGFTAPILIDENGMILAGHARWAVAKRRKMAEVPTVTIAGLSQEQKQAYVIADNRLAELGKADKDILAMELGELQDVGFDLESVGFSPMDLDDLLGEGALPGEDGEGKDVDGTVTCPECGCTIPSKVTSVKRGGRARR